MLPVALLASALGSPDDGAMWEARLRAWFDGSFAPDALRRWSRAAPTQAYTYAERTRWGPDATVAPRSCAEVAAEFGAVGLVEDGYREADVAAARGTLGPGWATDPTGFDGWSVTGAFRRSPAKSRFDGPHLSVTITRVPVGVDLDRMLVAGVANGCPVAKTSFAFVWSGDTLVRLDSPCAEESRFAGWTLLVLDALPGWTGAPAAEHLVYGPCGTMGIRLVTRGEVERDARR